MHNCLALRIDIQTYWHAGTGRGHSHEIDSVVHRDRDGLPTLPGRTVKGLVRDAVTAAAALGWYESVSIGDAESHVVNRLFGPLGIEGAMTFPGWLHFSDAILADDIRPVLRSDSTLRSALYANLFTTAIEHDRGSALNKTLRGMEVAVAMTLFAALSLDPNANQHQVEPDPEAATHAIEWLTTALPLLRSLGSHRHRGMGRATFTLVELQQ